MRISNTPIIPDEEMMKGTLQYFLTQNVGREVVITFLIGTQNTTQRSGEIYFVGSTYVVLHDVKNSLYTLCNLYSIKFITMYENGKPVITKRF